MKCTGGRESCLLVCLQVFRPSPVITTVTVGAARLRMKIPVLRLRSLGLDNHLNSARLLADGGARFPDSMIGPTLRGCRRADHARSDSVMTLTLQACQGSQVSVRRNSCVVVAVVVSCQSRDAEGAVSARSSELVRP
jgi:hypothetical protein